MTPQQIVGVAVRLFAIWLAITAIQAAGMGIGTNVLPGIKPTLAPYVFAALFLVVAIALWFFPMVIAHKLVPRTKFDNVLHVPAQEIIVIACIVLGLWVLVVRAVPAIAYYVTVTIYWSTNGQSVSSLDQSLHFGFVLGLVQLAMALLLLFKARSISAFIQNGRAD